MKVYHSIDEFIPPDNSTITVGTFDGVHVGHKKIIERLLQSAAQIHGQSIILTFFPHPRMVLYPQDNDLKLLNTMNEKTELLEKAGVDHLIIQPFTKEFSRLTATEFIREILVNKIHLKKIVIGYNHQFGRNREGTFEQLTEMSLIHHFVTEEIPEQDVNHVAVSSTKIRNALIHGEIETANELLGYPFSLRGTVVKGMGIGKTLGFPTANISISEEYKIIPAEGIYAAKIRYDNQEFGGMLYIGNRPVLQGKTQSIEATIFGFNKDIYGEEISVSLITKIRNDIPFTDLESLKTQMNRDKMIAEKILNN